MTDFAFGAWCNLGFAAAKLLLLSRLERARPLAPFDVSLRNSRRLWVLVDIDQFFGVQDGMSDAEEYKNKNTFLGWDMILKKFTLKKFK